MRNSRSGKGLYFSEFMVLIMILISIIGVENRLNEKINAQTATIMEAINSNSLIGTVEENK